MMNLILVLALVTAGVQSTPTQPQSPQNTVELWFRYFNQLDGSEEATERLLSLYAPDAMHQTGPSSRQVGPVFYEGHAAIRKMAGDVAAKYTELAYRVEYTSANEKSVQLNYMAEGPWGGPAVGVEFTGAFTVKETGKRYMVPGAAFFYLQNGKIRRLRLYEATSELAEVMK
jgi:hypothetical protein